MKYFIWILRIIVVMCLVIYIFWRCRFGFANIDEAFHLHMAYRLWQGDALLVDCWDLQQLFGIVLLPVISLYMKIVSNTDGIFLNFRYLFSIIMILTSIIHYIKWKKYDDAGAFWGAVAYMLSVPFTVLSLTYNSTGIIFFSLAITFFVTNEKQRVIDYLLAGSFYALATLCSPFLILLYPPFTIACLIGKRKIKELVFITIACVFWALILLFFVFSHASFSDIITAIPNYFNDPAHANRSIVIIIRDWVGHLLLVQGVWSFILTVLLGGIFFFQLYFDKKELIKINRYFSAYCLIGIALLLTALCLRCWIDFFMLPICLLATVTFKLINEKYRSMILWGVLPVFGYSFCICAGSNQGSYLVSSVMAAGIVPAFVIINSVANNIFNNCKKIYYKIILIAIITITLSGQIIARYNRVWWDSPIRELNYEIAFGPEHGIKTTQIIGEWCQNLITMAQNEAPMNKDALVLFSPSSLWQYFAVPNRIGAYSAWITDMDETLDDKVHMKRLEEYYKLNPTKIPTTIIIPSNAKRTISKFEQNFGYNIKKDILDRCVLYYNKQEVKNESQPID